MGRIALRRGLAAVHKHGRRDSSPALTGFGLRHIKKTSEGQHVSLIGMAAREVGETIWDRRFNSNLPRTVRTQRQRLIVQHGPNAGPRLALRDAVMGKAVAAFRQDKVDILQQF